MEICDTLIHALWTLPIAPENIALQDHSVAVTNGNITAIGPRTELSQTFHATEVIELANHIVLPGLINTHGHAAMTLLRGAGEDQSLKAWLEDTIWPMEAALVNDEFVRLGTELAVAEMLLSGTTTFSDMYFLPETAAKVVDAMGIRAQLAFTIIESPNAWSKHPDEAFDKGLALVDQYAEHSRLHIALGPHSAYSLSAADLHRVGDVAAMHSLEVQIHLHETAKEVADAKAQFGQSWIERLHAMGLLGEHVQAVHMTQVTTAELQLVADSKTKIVHCPTSNLKLASGYCPVTEFHCADVPIGIGTDGAASNNRLDMFDETRLASLLAKHHQMDAAQGEAPEMLRMATLGGAEVLNLAAITGSLEVGKQADLISVDINQLGMVPLYDPFAALIHSNAGHAVDNVWVQGHRCVDTGQITHSNNGDLAARVQAWHSARAR